MYVNGKIKEYYKPRVADIVEILRKDNKALKDAIVADKVIGKTAGSLLAFGGVKEVYARTLSKIAVPVLERNGIAYKYNNLVDYIENNTKTGMCPMESRFKDEENIEKIYNHFVKTSVTTAQ